VLVLVLIIVIIAGGIFLVLLKLFSRFKMTAHPPQVVVRSGWLISPHPAARGSEEAIDKCDVQ
jgi:uncharacterized membrane protein YqiK